ncbi:unnamed protein product [Tuber melanosporum]|uniref:(Perigord truffle) hypothetical protein n=1 Tax=Tuber melanosporum (strain Mel28) TaxID=656061 RepID=D5GMK6_TUBMM|nr:uncharacterized protein GSTUM_00010779001 [Tuber melanosporum]CAZ85749.1 unnamed protein product [Tuber melanosporum]
MLYWIVARSTVAEGELRCLLYPIMIKNFLCLPYVGLGSHNRMPFHIPLFSHLSKYRGKGCKTYH